MYVCSGLKISLIHFWGICRSLVGTVSHLEFQMSSPRYLCVEANLGGSPEVTALSYRRVDGRLENQMEERM